MILLSIRMLCYLDAKPLSNYATYSHLGVVSTHRKLDGVFSISIAVVSTLSPNIRLQVSHEINVIVCDLELATDMFPMAVNRAHGYTPDLGNFFGL